MIFLKWIAVRGLLLLDGKKTFYRSHSFCNLINTRVKNEFFKNVIQSNGRATQLFFNFKLFVILMKNLFIMKASCFSSETSFPFSLSSILFEFIPLLLNYGLIIFQNLLLSDKSFKFRFWKYSFLVLRSSVTQKLCCFLKFAQFISVLFRYKCFLILTYA